MIGHIVTGNMNFVNNVQLRNVLNKGLNFRVPRHRDPVKVLTTIKTSLKKYITNISKKAKLSASIFDQWYHKVVETVECKLNSVSTALEGNMKKFINIFDKPDVSSALADLHKSYVFVPTDKSNCNISIVCKKFYLESIEKELSENFESVNNLSSDNIRNRPEANFLAGAGYGRSRS